MNRPGSIILLIGFALLCSCTDVPVQSSGPSPGPMLTRLDVEFDPVYRINPDEERGSTDLSGYMIWSAKRLTAFAAVNFVPRFDRLMTAHGVTLVAHEDGVPVLYIHSTGAKTVCIPTCRTFVEYTGTLQGAAPDREWHLTSTLDAYDVDDKMFDEFVQAFADSMVKDGLIQASR
jgi:hypothetical protein